MAALAYVLPPVSGLIAYLKGSSATTRFHGLQAVVFGASWPAVLYAASAMSTGAAQAMFVLGGAVWAWLVWNALRGRQAGIPALTAWLAAASAVAPTARDDG